MSGSKNIVFIAQSLDGFIAGKNGEIDWLNSIPNPEQEDMGYKNLMEEIDALIMGRVTFETVCTFEGSWPYEKPVFVLSNTLKKVPEKYASKVFMVQGPLKQVLANLHNKGFLKLYIDGGSTIQNFLKEDLINELRITTIPILLGGGAPLFGDLNERLKWEHVKTQVYFNQAVQSHYKRKLD